MTHDAMCPVVAIHLWQICLCEAFARVRGDERKRAVFIADHTINDTHDREDAIAWINGEPPTWWHGESACSHCQKINVIDGSPA